MKKNLIIIIGSLEVGGAEKHVATIYPKLVSLGWSIKVVTLTNKGPLAPILEKAGISVSPSLSIQQHEKFQKLPRLLGRMLRMFWCIKTLVSLFKKSNNTIIHFFLPEAYVLGMFSAKLANFKGPTIMSRRSMRDYQIRRPILAWCEKLLRNSTSFVTGNSQAVIHQLEEEHILKEKLKLIYNGINLEPYRVAVNRSEIRKILNIQDEALVLIMVCNLIPYKGHSDLLKALSIVKNKLPIGWHLLCVGRDNGIGESLKQEAKVLNIGEQVVWLGSRFDVANLQSASDIGILCSHEEGFSNAVLEGMAAGLPMVVTDVGGNKEAVLDEENGYVVQAKDPQGLAEAILKLAVDPAKAKQFGQNGQSRVKAFFSLDACVDAYIQLYESCQ